ncbi:hypothetical protein [Brevibacterium linens]|uniref:Glycosyltransferase family 1 protein n=1 Tax=Brevibacterium linens TaxID=1703 RepID=A0A0B9A1U7_BRELN|nr:hypothetical protein [Brevibacterium linens]KHS52735.1 hypothetical protein AE0388_1718 [Brevibacterium linens]
MTDRPLIKVSRTLRKATRHQTGRNHKFPPIEHPRQEISKLAVTFEVEPGDLVSIAVESRCSSTSPEADGAGLLEIRAIDRNGLRTNIPGWAYMSSRVGEYHYLNTQGDDELALTQFKIRVPDQVNRIELYGHRWKRNIDTEIIGTVLVSRNHTGPILHTSTGKPLPVSAEYYREELEVPSHAGTASIRVPVRGGEKASNVPFSFEFSGEEGRPTLPQTQLPQHKEYGPISMANIQPRQEGVAEFRIPIPEGAKTIAVQGIAWFNSTPTIMENASIDFLPRDTEYIRRFLADLKPTDQLILIDTTAPPVGHDTLSLRPNNLALAWAESGIKVIFLPFSTIQDESPLPVGGILQLDRKQLPAVKHWLLENRHGPNNVYVCSSFPDHSAVTLVDMFNANGWNTVYECRDDMEEFNRVGYSKWYNPQFERRVLESVKYVTAVSVFLAAKLQSISTKDIPVTVTPNGVNRELIELSTHLRSDEVLYRRKDSKIFGYVGHLTDAWFDWDLLIRSATARPNYFFEIVGHGKPDYVTLPSNVKYLGPKPHSELIDIVSNWRAGLIPFVDSALTRSVDPNKIYEYYAWGLPCISAPMGSVDSYPCATVYNNQDEFIAALDEIISHSMLSNDLELIEVFLEECSWAARARQTTNILFGEA